MIISHCNKILGVVINTRTMTVRIPENYMTETVFLLTTNWHDNHRSFTLSQIEELTGRLGHIAQTTPWLRFPMIEAYISIKACISISKEHLVATSAQFCRVLKLAKSPAQTQDGHRRKSFGISRVAKMIHKNDKMFFINRTPVCPTLLSKTETLPSRATSYLSPWERPLTGNT